MIAVTTSRNASNELKHAVKEFSGKKKMVYFARQEKPLEKIISFARYEGIKKIISLGCWEKKFLFEEISVKENSWERENKKEFDSMKELVAELNKFK